MLIVTEYAALIVIYHPNSSKFHKWTTVIKLLFMSGYGFCSVNDHQDICQNGYPLFRRRVLGGALCQSPTVLVCLSITERSGFFFQKLVIHILYFN